MAWSVNDLGLVTNLLITQLSDAVSTSPNWATNQFTFEVSGQMPAVSRTDTTRPPSVLNLYLLHVSRDPYWRNTPVQGGAAQLSNAQPLSLNLSYLLTSFSDASPTSWQNEQYLMSVALGYFHANPIYRGAAVEFTVTVEADSIEEMSRLWQAITVPIRLSAMFRVAVVFLAPDQPPVTASRTPVEIGLSVSPDLDAVAPVPPPEPRLFEVAMTISYRVNPGASDGSQISAVPGKPVVVGGQTVRGVGIGLDGVDAAAVYLSPAAGGAEWPATGWRVAGSIADDAFVLALPAAYAATPASGQALTATPPPGQYLIAVGNATTDVRSNTLPLAIGPMVQGVGTGEPVLVAAAGTYTFGAAGLVAGETAVLLDETPLTIADAVAPGVATVDAAAGSISLRLPATGLVSDSYVQVRVLVNSIEAPPGWWILVP